MNDIKLKPCPFCGREVKRLLTDIIVSLALVAQALIKNIRQKRLLQMYGTDDHSIII